MFLLDANILIYAFRRDSPFHGPCYNWLLETLNQGQTVTAPGLVELALLRITTLPALGTKAASLAAVFAFLDALRNYPNYERVEPGKLHDKYLEQVCTQLGLAGNDINDAYLAALALEHEAVLVSNDTGFKRFPNLRCLNPLNLV